jgi:hypothetical protein
MSRGWKVLAAGLVLALLPACNRIDRDSPEAAIASARKVVEQGHAEKLALFIYADNKDMRRLVNRFGVLLGNMQRLGEAVQEKFPKDVAALKAKAEQAAKDGKASSLLGQLTSQLKPQRGKRKPPDPAQMDASRDAFSDGIKNLFADPYGWIKDSEKRLTTAFLTDDSVALLWDGEPVMAPLGMIMKKDADGKWCFVLPTNAPGISSFMPKTEREYEIFGFMIKTVDKTVTDLTQEVKAGHVHSMEDLSHKAGEMALPPAMMVMYAYSQLEEAKKKEAKQEVKPAGNG